MFFREGSEIKWLRSETFLFWRAAGEEIFALEPPNKPFSFDFRVGPTLCETLEKCARSALTHGSS